MKNYRTFLQKELERVTQDEQAETETALYLLHYYQAMMEAVLCFAPCSRCAACVSDRVAQLKQHAQIIKGQTYTNFHDLRTACTAQLAIAFLCSACQRRIQDELCEQFYLLRQHKKA